MSEPKSRYCGIGRPSNGFDYIPRIGIFMVELMVMAKNTSILLGEHFEAFISKELRSGKYSSASEVVRAALRLLETEEEKKEALLAALKKGEKSGRVTDFDAASHRQKLHKKYL